jgi:2-keto-4-pentenoate hydratase/2-oxohepta-3-ene-1,7-dioic acid hydratase in catechol pathway
MADQGDTQAQRSTPLAPGARIFCVGRNYATHRDELRNSPTPWPEVFLRLPSTAAAADADIVVPAASSRFDYEGELGVIIGRGGRNIPATDASDHVGGLCVVNDFTARDWQWRGKQWTPGKNFDRTLPVSPAVEAAGIDWSDLALETRLNGAVVQSDRTSSLIFDIPTQIEFISTWTRLNAGDLICTGTPGGVGAAREPPVWLSAGDIVEVSVEHVGSITNKLVVDSSELATDAWREVAQG